MDLSMKQKESWMQRTDLWLPVGRGLSRDGVEAWVSRFKLLYTEWINNKVLLYSTENYIIIKYHMINHNGKIF